jgi:hypothetical protein
MTSKSEARRYAVQRESRGQVITISLSHDDLALTPRGKRLEAAARRRLAQQHMDMARLLEQAANDEEEGA